MVIGEEFVWAHLAKTGGTTTARMFEIIQSGDIVIDQPRGPDEHWIRNQSFAMRERLTGKKITAGKKRIMNFRRLPFLMLSMLFFKQKESGFAFNPDDLLSGTFSHELRDELTGELVKPVQAVSHTPDDMLHHYEYKKIDYWIRLEYLHDDFIRVMERFYTLAERQKSEMSAINLNVGEYDRNLSTWFSPDELKKLYEHCPLWADLEEELYGSLITLEL